MQSEARSCCKNHLPGLISGIIFALIALIHLFKIFLGWSLVINGAEVSNSISWVIILIALIMAVWDLSCVCCKKCCNKRCETFEKK